MAGIEIHWADLVKVAEVSAVFGIGIVAVFALGVLGLSRAEAAREAASEAPAGSGRHATGLGRRATGLAVAGFAFTVCAAAVLYGLYLLVPQLRR